VIAIASLVANIVELAIAVLIILIIIACGSIIAWGNAIIIIL
jgi:hypothetical protein